MEYVWIAILNSFKEAAETFERFCSTAYHFLSPPGCLVIGCWDRKWAEWTDLVYSWAAGWLQASCPQRGHPGPAGSHDCDQFMSVWLFRLDEIVCALSPSRSSAVVQTHQRLPGTPVHPAASLQRYTQLPWFKHKNLYLKLSSVYWSWRFQHNQEIYKPMKNVLKQNRVGRLIVYEYLFSLNCLFTDNKHHPLTSI